MKKIALFMAGLLFFGAAANAQDKEALKAQKEAQKAAAATLKKATNIYEGSIANPQYGRKETDYDKLSEALPLIKEALANEYTKNDAQTYKTAAEIEYQMWLKTDAQLKADPENAELSNKFVQSSSDLVGYCTKYDELASQDSKIKPEQLKLDHIRYQTVAVNAALTLLQKSQYLSGSDKQEELKDGAKYSKQFLEVMENSTLMKDFENQNLTEWKEWGKAFYAQSLYHIEGTPESEIAAAYDALKSTRYKTIAYQSMTNYYKQKGDDDKWRQSIAETIEELKGDTSEGVDQLRSTFIAQYLQDRFIAKDAAGVEKYGQMLIDEYPESENTAMAYTFQGELLRLDNKFDEAENLFLAGAAKFPDNSQCMKMACTSAFQKAQTNGFKNADMEHAVELLKKAEAQYPDEPEIWGEFLYVLYNNMQKPQLRDKYKKYHE